MSKSEVLLSDTISCASHKHFLFYYSHVNVLFLFSFSFSDLTTYDTAKQFILRNTRLDDNAFVHAMSRYTTCGLCIKA